MSWNDGKLLASVILILFSSSFANKGNTESLVPWVGGAKRTCDVRSPFGTTQALMLGLAQFSRCMGAVLGGLSPLPVRPHTSRAKQKLLA